VAWRELLALWPRLEAADGMGAIALRFLTLMAARSGEVRIATWDEIDLQAATWVIRAEGTKMEREHRVPQSAPALDLLRELQPISSGRGNALVFPSSRRGPPRFPT
jgi:integrase